MRNKLNLILAVLSLSLAANVSAQPTSRTGTSSMVLLIDGKVEGILSRVQGGNLVGEVVEEFTPGQIKPTKRLINPKVEELEVELSLSTDSALFDWINSSMDGKLGTRNLSVITCDLNNKAVSHKEYAAVLPLEFSFSQMSASTREQGKLVLKVLPTSMVEGPVGSTCASATSGRRMAWFSSNFSFELGGTKSRMVSQISGLTVKFNYSAEGRTGRRTARGLEKVTISDLSLVAGQADKGLWQDWFNTFVVQGRSSNDEERSGAIILYSTDLKTEIGRINLEHLGIYRLSDNFETGARVSTFNVSLYTESVEFSIK